MTSSKIFSHASSSFRRGSKAHRRLRLGLQHPSILPGLDHFFFVTVENKVFVPVQLELIFAAKAKSLPKKVAAERHFTQVEYTILITLA
jgi:hypothetical protein